MFRRTVGLIVVLGMLTPFAAIAQNETGMTSTDPATSKSTSTTTKAKPGKVKSKLNSVKAKMKHPAPFKGSESSKDPTKGD